MNLVRHALTLSLLLTCIEGSHATPVSVIQRSFVLATTSVPLTFEVLFDTPMAGVTGQVKVTTHVIGLYADGGRDGVSIATEARPNVATGFVRQAGGGMQMLTGAGSAAALAAAGGSAGDVATYFFDVVNPGTSGDFSVTTTQPFSGQTRSQRVQSSFGAVLMDRGGDGASLSGNLASGALLGIASAFNGPPHTLLGSSFSANGLTGSVLDSGSALAGCSSTACTFNQFDFQFGLSGGGDQFLTMARAEMGGDDLLAPVMAEYDLVSDSALFDCGVAGCDMQLVSLAFGGSGGGDMFGFIVRQEIELLAGTVPEPSSLALAGLALAGLAWRGRLSQRLLGHGLGGRRGGRGSTYSRAPWSRLPHPMRPLTWPRWQRCWRKAAARGNQPTRSSRRCTANCTAWRGASCTATPAG